MTQAQLARLQRDWNKYAGEVVSIETIGGAVYCYCTELAALRLFHKYSLPAKTKAGYSQNLNQWFFRLEIGS